MADRLATPQDLASLADRDYDDLTDLEKARAALLVECATAVVQSVVGGQRIVEATSTAVLPAPAGLYLDLPQWPVRAVTSVSIDGRDPDTLWRLDGGRVWRSTWILQRTYPGSVAVTYDHGYPADSQGVQLAKHAVLSLARPVFDNPSGAVRTQLDDFAEAYEAMATRMEASKFLRDRLVDQYGLPAVAVRMGGA